MARILLVEDDPDVQPLLEHILVTEGYHVTAAASVTVALSLLGAQPFDLVICDVNLPDGNGLTVADQAAAAGVKALVLTGQGLSLAPGSLARYDYLLKPVRVAELGAAIERCLSGGAGEVVKFPKKPTG
jgi:two-component system, NtrC family, response regulator PilR